MKSTSSRIYAVLTADIVASRRIEEFRRRRDQKLRPISTLHVNQKLILSDYAVTAWDEFQAILTRPAHVPTVILDLRRHFHPLQLWIAIGIGHVSEPNRKPVNKFAGGEAFERAREAVNQLKDKPSKFRMLTAFASGNTLFDSIGNTVYSLHDTLLQGVSGKQWQTMNVQLATKRQDLTAKKMDLDESTVSRNLRRGFYWQIEYTRRNMEAIIKAYFP
jgi:hypothetical protein